MRADPRFDDEAVFGDDLGGVLKHCVHLQSSALDGLMARIGRETSVPGFASELMVEGLSLSMLIEAVRLLRSLRAQCAHKGGLAGWRPKRLKERIHGDGPPASPAELATLCGLSRRHLIRAFREQTGETIGAYAQRVAMARAQHLLRDTRQPVKAVAVTLGFSSPAAFATAFRRSFGLSPKAFRARQSPPFTPRD